MPAPIAPKSPRPASQVAPPAVDPARPADYQLLDDIIRVINGFSSFGIDARDLYLVPNVVLPQKFRVRELPKYKGLSCPRSHLTMYCRKMASYIDNDNLLIHCFQDSLAGASLDWYMSQERSKIRSWRYLSEAFLKQYKYNLDMASTRLQLQNQSQRSNESFKEYAQRWRKMASRVRPVLSDNELVDIFMGTLQGLYFEKMIGSSLKIFADMVTIGERVESGLKSGKITDTAAQQTTNKRLHGGFAKKKKGEANVVMARARPRYQFPTALMPYYPYLYVAAAHYQQPLFQYQPQKELVPYFIHVGAIVQRELPAASPPFNHRHNPNATRAYHAGYIGHSTEDCWTLKKRIQELIDQEILSFSEEKPNMKTYPLPNYNGAEVHAVIEEEVCEFDPDNCEQLKGCVQELMDEGLMHFSKSQAAEELVVIEPITIVYRKKKVEAPPRRIQMIDFRVQTLFPYQNTKAVP
ncbi:uncharacterized protein LOC127123077 [Lathyrus oleraceus]|uniref:uncharacterized protein LOC127123077 n=1 Tax=Pisum sativum TaxID=3888 RepID=UPI0021D1D201|nr:uncharacterized protein LOC127123077 [Pisum sativum]